MDKNNLRKLCKNKRESIQEKHERSQAILENLKTLKLVENARVVGLYASFKGEVETEEIFFYLKKFSVEVAYPKTIGKNVMKFYIIEDLSDLESGAYGILEPKGLEKEVEPDVIIVPGLAFSEKMDRLGYGAGYYDRYLDNKEVLKIGLCYQDLIVESLETDEHDVKMDYVITEDKIYKK